MSHHAAGNRWTDEMTVKFIQLYRVRRCLWDTAHPSYKCRELRSQALTSLVTAMAIEGFNVTTCKIKIKNLRSHYCQELKRIYYSKLRKDSAVYTPSLMWFPVIDDFLKNHVHQTIFVEDKQYLIPYKKKRYKIPTENCQVEMSTSSQSITNDYIENERECVENGGDYIDNSREYIDNGRMDAEEEIDSLAKLWSIKIKKLSRNQRIYAEKLVMDILLEGELGNLHMNTSVQNWLSCSGVVPQEDPIAVIENCVSQAQHQFESANGEDALEQKMEEEPARELEFNPQITVKQEAQEMPEEGQEDHSGEEVPTRRKRSHFRKMEKLKRLKLKSTSQPDNEFDLFCKGVAMQLNNMPLENALRLQMSILNAVTEERLKSLGNEQNT